MYYENVENVKRTATNPFEIFHCKTLTIANISALDPLQRKTERTIAGLEALSDILPNVVPQEEWSSNRRNISLCCIP